MVRFYARSLESTVHFHSRWAPLTSVVQQPPVAGGPWLDRAAEDAPQVSKRLCSRWRGSADRALR